MTLMTRKQGKRISIENSRLMLLDLAPEEVEAELADRIASWEEKPYRVRQILRQIYQRGTLDFSLMTDLSAGLRERLCAAYEITPLKAGEAAVSGDGTRKRLWRLGDGESVESVEIPMERDYYTVCLSTQTGCAFGCSFCATGKLGAGRNLSTGEILGQALASLSTREPPEKDTRETDRPRSPNFVFMGMGEPLLNYENLKKALRIMNHNDFMQVGSRRITVSTVGLPEEMLRFSRDFPQMKLAVSLHAATEPLRKKLMPAARRVPLSRLLEACVKCYRITGKRITFEYLLLPGVNDRPEDVEALAGISSTLPCKINLISFNRVEGVPFKPPSEQTVERFQKALRSACKQAVTFRRSHGADIAAACGQLAARDRQ